MLFARRDVLVWFGRVWPWGFVIGVWVCALYLMLMVDDPTGGTLRRRLAMCVVAGLSVWLLIAGIVGFFLTHLDAQRPVVRYLSDAAYWMYIVHLPFTMLIPGLLANAGLTALAKFPIVVSGTALVSLGSDHFLVRSTPSVACPEWSPLSREVTPPRRRAGVSHDVRFAPAARQKDTDARRVSRRPHCSSRNGSCRSTSCAGSPCSASC